MEPEKFDEIWNIVWSKQVWFEEIWVYMYVYCILYIVYPGWPVARTTIVCEEYSSHTFAQIGHCVMLFNYYHIDRANTYSYIVIYIYIYTIYHKFVWNCLTISSAGIIMTSHVFLRLPARWFRAIEPIWFNLHTFREYIK